MPQCHCPIFTFQCSVYPDSAALPAVFISRLLASTSHLYANSKLLVLLEGSDLGMSSQRFKIKLCVHPARWQIIQTLKTHIPHLWKVDKNVIFPGMNKIIQVELCKSAKLPAPHLKLVGYHSFALVERRFLNTDSPNHNNKIPFKQGVRRGFGISCWKDIQLGTRSLLETVITAVL